MSAALDPARPRICRPVEAALSGSAAVDSEGTESKALLLCCMFLSLRQSERNGEPDLQLLWTSGLRRGAGTGQSRAVR